MAVQARHQLLRSDSGRPSARDDLPPRCPLRVISGRTDKPRAMSALPPITDVGRRIQVSIWVSVHEYTP